MSDGVRNLAFIQTFVNNISQQEYKTSRTNQIFRVLQMSPG